MGRTLVRVCTALILLHFWPGQGFCRVWIVPGDATDIQSAIDQADVFDYVHVSETWVEPGPIEMKRGVTVERAPGSTLLPTINALGSTEAVTFPPDSDFSTPIWFFPEKRQ